MERIAALRKEALAEERFSWEFYYHYMKSYTTITAENEYEHYSLAFYDAFSRLTPSISEGELIVGKYAHPLSPEQAKEWDEIYQPLWKQFSSDAGKGQDSHMAIDYDLLLTEGILGIQAKIDGYLTDCEDAKRPFYLACKRCLDAVMLHAAHYSETARILAEQTKDPKRRKELQRLADICLRVPAYPASGFYEAIQSVHFITYCLSLDPFRFWQQFQLGHPDRYLLPFYEKDLREGRLTKEYAQLLLDCLGIQINMRVPHGLSSGYMVGGRDSNGAVVANDLTKMCMQVISDIHLVYPSVGLCYTSDMPETYLRKACEILATGASHPAIFNDDIITEGLMAYGVPASEAHSYIHSTCVEITPASSSNVWVASPYTNMVQLLLDCMDREYDSYEALQQTIFDRLSASIQANFELQNTYRKHRAQHSMIPLLSCFVNDCLASGTDIERGGARYNWIMPSFVGIGNLADSLFAIKSLVFDTHELTMAEYKQMLDADFEGYEEQRLRILNRLPKYGNDSDEVDSIFDIFTRFIAEECRKHTPIYQNAHLIPSVFCWVMHERFGSQTGASPDGRKTGFPLGDGSGPCQGREQNGPTASILSSTKWSHKEFIGGVAVNMKFSKKQMSPDAIDNILELIKIYLSRGGFELQINVVDRETLLQARQTPENYQDLVVRIGGYSDYFVKLSPQMQEEILLRTAHTI